MEKNNFIFHRNWWDALRDEGDELLGSFIRNLCQYAFDGEEKEPQPDLRLTIRHAKTEMEKDAKRYDEICEKNRQNVLNRWQKRNNTMEYDRIQPNTINTDNDNDNDNDNELSDDNIKENKKRTTSKVKHDDESLPDYVTPDFADIYREWMNYRSQVGKPFKSGIGRERFYNRLVRLSDGDPQKARLIIQQSEANEWQGIFELKQDNNNEEQRNKNNRPNHRPSPEDNIADAQKAAVERMQSVINSAD